MRNIEAIRYKNRLDNLFKKIAFFVDDFELQSQWSRYLCVLVSGFLETSISEIYSEYVQQRAAPNVANFAVKKLDGFQNPKMGKIIELTSSFNPDWGENLRQQTEGELKDAIDSICANRNHIAHGEDTGITYARISSWYLSAIRVIEIIEAQCQN